MIILGLLLGLVGADTNTGLLRYTFGLPQLADGIGFVVVAMGLFGFSEIIVNLERRADREVVMAQINSLMPTREDFAASWKAVLRATGIGALLGILPGGGAVLGSFAAYTLEKRIAKDPSRFGNGAIEGVASPESANNAGAQTSFISLLTPGIASNAVMALMVGAVTIHGITPGPQVMTERPELFWGMIASMWIGNLMLVILNLPLIGIWVKLLSVHQAGLRTRAPAAWFCARTDDGRQPEARDVAFAWQPRRVFYPSAEPGVAAGCPGIAHCGRASRGEKEARRRFSGVIDD